MAVSTGSVTIHGGSGISAVLSVTNDAFGLNLASSFQALTAQLASSPASFYSYNAGSTFLAIQGGLGDEGVAGTTGSSNLLVGNGTNLFYEAPITGYGIAAPSVAGEGTPLCSAGPPPAAPCAAPRDFGDGNDTVLSGAGSDTLALGSGRNGYLLGFNAEVHSEGTDTIIGGVGSTVATISGASSSIATSDIQGASLVADATSATNATFFTYTNATITGASSGTTTVDVDGPTTVNAGSGGTTFTQSGGSLLLNASKGETDNITVTGLTNPDTLYGASGAVINFTGSTHNNVFVANDPIHTVGGAVKFNAASASGGNQFWAGSGNATLIGGTGNDTLVAGTGSSQMTGGLGVNEFDLFSVNGGSGTSVTITDFEANASNHITLFGYGASGVAAAVQNQAQQPNGSGTLIKLTDGSQITLQGVNHVTAANFLSTEPGT